MTMRFDDYDLHLVDLSTLFEGWRTQDDYTFVNGSNTVEVTTTITTLHGIGTTDLSVRYKILPPPAFHPWFTL